MIFDKVSDTHEKLITKIIEANLSCFAEETVKKNSKGYFFKEKEHN
jgi:hypothetical protein